MQETAYPWWDLRAYQYELPNELIAQHPAQKRDQSRLLHYSLDGSISHHVFHDLPSFLKEGDVLVLNNCKVIPARLFVRRRDTGTRIELLMTKEIGEGLFDAMVRPGHSCKIGAIFGAGTLEAKVVEILEDGQRRLQFNAQSKIVNNLLEAEGQIPLPPYIERPSGPDKEDKERYQTVYAKAGRAVAAPTAGLHFTNEILAQLKAKGVTIVEVTLDVGIGTFKPVKTQDIREHDMHSEHFVFSKEDAAILNQARQARRRIIAVGTTSLRVLESCLSPQGLFESGERDTAIFIHPPCPVRSIDALITNFHLPGSTLLMLIASFVGPNWRQIYETAVKERYRFFSYGDSMLLEHVRPE